MKARHVFGIITIAGVIGVSIYAIKKFKDAQKLEEQSISLAEAREIVKQQENTVRYCETDVKATKMMYDELAKYPDDIQFGTRTVGGKLESVSIIGVRKVGEPIEEHVDEMDDENSEEEGSTTDHPDNILSDRPPVKPITEEDKKLRYEPNSMEALNQYKTMELADWHHTDEAYEVLMKLFDFPFQPTCDGDEFLRNNIIDHRVQFFGFDSRWNKEITYAEVILYYARAAEFNCDETVRYWAEYFLDFNEFTIFSSSQEIDEELLALNAHTYFNEERETFGLFGLTRPSMDSAIKIAQRNVDCSVTYDIEFQEFLKSVL